MALDLVALWFEDVADDVNDLPLGTDSKAMFKGAHTTPTKLRVLPSEGTAAWAHRLERPRRTNMNMRDAIERRMNTSSFNL